MAKKAVDLVKAKADKQKKIAIGGAVLLVLLLALEGPKMLKQLHGGGGNQVPAWLAASRAQASGAAPASGAVSLAAPSLAGANPGGTTTAAPTGLAAADAAPTAGVGQLASFSRFATKDPFAVQVAPGTKTSVPAPPTPTVTAPAGGTGSGGLGTGGAGPVSGGVPSVPARPASPPTKYGSAVIAVNGTLGTVAVGTDFGLPLGPAAASGKPLFHLISATAHTAKIAIAGGSYADGASALTLHQGKPVTLQNTADGTRYTLQLYPQGTTVTAATTTGSASPAPLGGESTTTTTTPAGATTTGAGTTTTSKR